MATKDISVGANPASTFPNSHLKMPNQPASGAAGAGAPVAAWAQPQATPSVAVMQQFREAVASHDWARAFAESKTTIQADAKWSATEERCSFLQCLCTMHQAQNVLEIGSFCGVAALAMAEAMPKDGKVVALEMERFFVDFGAEFRQKSPAGSNVETSVGAADESLKDLVAEVTDGDRRPFDFVVIDCDKTSMAEYLKYVRSPYFLSDGAVICMDVTPFKGQAPARYKKFGAEEHLKTSSGEEEIAALRKTVASLPDFVAHEFGGLLVIQKTPPAQVAAAAAAPSGADRDEDEEEDE